ncbi:MAG: 6-carboxytetrahydropterin synthase [Flavobacteriales bacterium]
MQKNKTAVYRKVRFNAAHRLHNASLSDEENRLLYGKCNNVNFHGHNYELVVKVLGYTNEKTGYVIDMKVLRDLLEKHIVERFDHKNLNLDVVEFKHLNPTTENVAQVCYHLIRPELNSELELKIFLYETERNFVEYPA